MFVRWKRRKMRGKWGRGTYVRYAVLVESVRVEGKPRQRFVAHLAHIPERIAGMAIHRGLFWRDVNKRLDELQLDGETRARVTSKLLAVVPLTNEARSAAEKAELARLERLARSAYV